MTNQKSIKSVLFTIALLDFMGFTIAATLFPDLFINVKLAFLPEAWTHASRLLAVGVALSLYPLGQFLSASMLGALSDRFGRKRVITITLLGTVVACALTALSINLNLYILLFASRFLLGLFAGNVSVAQASMVDISDAKTRASNISLIQLSLGLAWVCGAPLGSFLSNNKILSWFNFSTPFWFLTVCLLLVFLVFMVTYQETLKNFKKTKVSLHPLHGLTLTLAALKDKAAADMFWVWLIFIAGWALFLQFLPTFFIVNFGYTAHSVGPLLAFMGGVFAGTQIFIARRFLKRYSPEIILCAVMLVPGVSAFAIGLAKSWWAMHISAFCFPFSMGFTLPALLAAISARGDASVQGALLGKAQSIQALMTIIVTLVGGKLFGVSQYMTTLIGGGMMMFAWIIFIGRKTWLVMLTNKLV